MRVVLAELAPRAGEPSVNLQRLRDVAAAAPDSLVIFPELYLTGYRLGDRLRTLAVRQGDRLAEELASVARRSRSTLVVGAPAESPSRSGEVENVALIVAPDGTMQRSVKRYLPTFGPFEEGLLFSPAGTSAPVEIGGRRVGLEICYDVFFPEVTRELAVAGAELLVNISASPTTSRALFERLLPARAVENGLPVVYVNRVGVEDGLVFGGGSGVWDGRGEVVATQPVAFPGLEAGERLLAAELDLSAAARWRPFRPVLRDVVARPPQETASPAATAFRSNAAIMNGAPPR